MHNSLLCNEKMMKKIIEIKGMTCGHCQKHVEDALNSIQGVSADVDLKKNIATVKIEKDIDDGILRRAIEEAGYEVVSITEKRGLFN